MSNYYFRITYSYSVTVKLYQVVEPHIDQLSKKDHNANVLYESVKHKVGGACLFCATVFGAKESVKECKVYLVDEFEQHISVKKLLSQGFHIMNF